MLLSLYSRSLHLLQGLCANEQFRHTSLLFFLRLIVICSANLWHPIRHAFLFAFSLCLEELVEMHSIHGIELPSVFQGLPCLRIEPDPFLAFQYIVYIISLLKDWILSIIGPFVEFQETLQFSSVSHLRERHFNLFFIAIPTIDSWQWTLWWFDVGLRRLCRVL